LLIASAALLSLFYIVCPSWSCPFGKVLVAIRDAESRARFLATGRALQGGGGSSSLP